MDKLTIALCQPNLVWNNPSANRALFNQVFDDYSGKTDIFLLPEMFTTGFLTQPEQYNLLEQENTVLWMKECAAKHNAAVAGSIIVSENGRFFNRFLWVTPNGELYSYDKRHLFSLGKEDKSYSPGKSPLVFLYRGWKIRPLICYDLRFPVWSRNSFVNNVFYYDLLLVVANWPASRSFHWRQLIMARAIENQSYVVGVNRNGSDQNGWNYNGGSCLASPEGFWQPEQPNRTDDVVLVSLNNEKLIKYRKDFPFALDWDKFSIEIN